MRSRILILGVLATTAGLIYTFAAAQTQPVSPASNDEKDILKATTTYTEAFNKGDLEGVLAVWSSEAEYVDETGKSTKGRVAVGELFKKVLQESKGVKMQIKTSAVRFLKDDIALQDGSAVLTQPDSEVESNPFSAVWVKKEGKWLLQLVRDLSGQAVAVGDGEEGAEAPKAHLKDLAWLVGDWLHEDKGMRTMLHGHWMKGEKFLILDYTIHNKDAEILSLTQIIGWDPTSDRLHSWVFDNQGGFGEGDWNRAENVWMVEVAGVTIDGRHGFGTHKFTNIDANTFSFEALDRELDGVPVANVKVTYQRTQKSK